MQYATPGTPSNALNLVGTGGAVTLGNVAAGTLSATSTQAVNGSQLSQRIASSGATNTTNLNTLGTTTAAALGGGATYSAATGITGLSYTLNGSAATYTDVVSGEQAIANGAAGPLQYATPGTPSNALNLVGTGGAVTLGNVAAGTLSSTSTQAVNGSQLYSVATNTATNATNLSTLGTTTAAALGGGASYSASTGITGLELHAQRFGEHLHQCCRRRAGYRQWRCRPVAICHARHAIERAQSASAPAAP